MAHQGKNGKTYQYHSSGWVSCRESCALFNHECRAGELGVPRCSNLAGYYTLVKAPTKFNLAALENACEVPFHKWAPENQEMLRAAVAEGAIPEVLMADGSWKVKPVDLAGASEIIRVIGWEPKRGYWEKNELGIVRESTPSEGELFLGKSQVKSGAFNLRIGAKDRLSRGYWNLLEISIVDGELAIQRVGGIHSEGIGNEPEGTVKMI